MSRYHPVFPRAGLQLTDIEVSRPGYLIHRHCSRAISEKGFTDLHQPSALLRNGLPVGPGHRLRDLLYHSK